MNYKEYFSEQWSTRLRSSGGRKMMALLSECLKAAPVSLNRMRERDAVGVIFKVSFSSCHGDVLVAQQKNILFLQGFVLSSVLYSFCPLRWLKIWSLSHVSATFEEWKMCCHNCFLVLPYPSKLPLLYANAIFSKVDQYSIFTVAASCNIFQ